MTIGTTMITQRPLVLVILLLALCLPRADALFFNLNFLEVVINQVLVVVGAFGLWNNLASSLCGRFQGMLPSVFTNCQCSGSYKVGKGLGGDFFCNLGNEVCLIDKKDSKDDDL